MKKQNIILALLALVGVCLAVVSAIKLPQLVVTQFKIGSGEVNTMPKALAVALPALLSVGGAAVGFFIKDRERYFVKCCVASCAGIAAFIIMLAVNLSGITQ